MRNKRTNVDWSKHLLTINTEGKTTIYRFAKPKTVIDSITFINTNGVLAVTGDYGNWLFCREFHPSAHDDVSDGYWIEKLTIASCQDPYEFDSERVKEEVEEIKKEHELSEEEIEWLDELVIASDDGEYSYIAKAIQYPSSFDTEMIPRGKIVKYWLLVIFDAFEEICRRMKEEEKL